MTYKGQLEGFPPEVVEKMLERQVEQGNPRDVTVFEEDATADDSQGGFTWSDTPEEEMFADFWELVIGHREFATFFNYYPARPDTLDNIFKL